MSANIRTQTARSYGIILGLIGLAIVLIQYSIGEFKVGNNEASTISTIMSIVSFLLGVVLVIMAQKKVREAQGYLSFGEGFKLGFTIYIISAMFTVAWMLIYAYVLEPDYQEALLDQTADQMYEQNSEMSDDAIDTALEWTRKFTTPLMLVLFTIVAAAFFGSIISLITAAIMKKDKAYDYIEESEQN